MKRCGSLNNKPLPEVLITDHAMPHMTGAELARRLAERHPKLHVILVTGYAELLGGEGAGLARLSNYLVRSSSRIHLPWSVRQTDSTSSVKALREMASAG
jgi:CheY-like chemotaxis protein